MKARRISNLRADHDLLLEQRDEERVRSALRENEVAKLKMELAQSQRRVTEAVDASLAHIAKVSAITRERDGLRDALNATMTALAVAVGLAIDPDRPA